MPGKMKKLNKESRMNAVRRRVEKEAASKKKGKNKGLPQAVTGGRY